MFAFRFFHGPGMRIWLTLILYIFPAAGFAAEANPVPQDPAVERIQAARKAIESNPKSWQSHIDLALEYCRKARDSEQPEYYKSARAEVDLALKLSPESYEARKAEARIVLGEGDLAGALRMASELNHRTPDDIAVWALLAEVNAQSGRYEEAVRDAQWILDLRAGSTLGFEEAASLRDDHGDAEGALEFYQEALRRTPLGDSIQRAWLLTSAGRVALSSGNAKAAEQSFKEALKMNPQSSVAAAGLANTWMLQQDYARAIPVLRQRFEAVHSAAALYDLACALDRAGQAREAATAFAQFEEMARQNAGDPRNTSIERIYYYVDRKHEPAEALRIAQAASELRRDYKTLAALAWALYANSRYKDADRTIREALERGNRDSDRFCRAARISAAAGDAMGAAQYAQEANSMRPGFCVDNPSSNQEAQAK